MDLQLWKRVQKALNVQDDDLQGVNMNDILARVKLADPALWVEIEQYHEGRMRLARAFQRGFSDWVHACERYSYMTDARSRYFPQQYSPEEVKEWSDGWNAAARSF